MDAVTGRLSTGAAMVCTLQCDLDPLDLEIVERAIEGISEAIKTCCSKVGLESDEGPEIALRRELAEMVRSSDVGDAEVLLECLIDGMRAMICGASCWASSQAAVMQPCEALFETGSASGEHSRGCGL